jgi:5-methylcytosine-specific restriction endonuclease McrA
MPFRPCLEAGCPFMALPGGARCREHRAVLERAKWLSGPYRDREFRRLRAEVARHLPLPCALCGELVDHVGQDAGGLTLDHIVPVAHGGSNVASNLRVAHRGCSSSRGRGPRAT